MIILGINYFFHDTSACIVQDGELKIAIEEERLSREKHTWKFPENAIKRCLSELNITPDDISHVAVSIDPGKHLGDKLFYALKNPAGLIPFAKHEFKRPLDKQRDFNRWYRGFFKNSQPKVHNVEHHLAHIAGSFYVSPYKEAALLSLDGAGEWATAWMGVGRDTEITCFSQSYFPNSLGSFYESVTEFCGFKPNYDEGKTMGLAPFGDPSVYYDRAKQIVNITDNGEIEIDLSYFEYQNAGAKRCSQKFYDVFGAPRGKNDEFEKRHEDVAAAFQQVLEDCALKQARILHEKTGMKHLVIAGGVSLNSVMNGKIVRETPFEDVYVMPAAGDNGTSLGAAYYVYNKILNQPRKFVHDNPYLGPEYSNEYIESVLKECKLTYEHHDDIEGKTAEILKAGNIIGWFQGRSEIGPRALGNRSILADPTQPGMKDKINAEVKHREAYRPFAPSCVAERKGEFFDMPVDAPFMLKVCDVFPDKREVIPAVTHVDGSARFHTVYEHVNKRYYTLLSKFGDLTGVPVLLNTSFNIMGEPMVENPYQAIRCFFSTGLDVLIIGNFVVHKKLS